MRGRRTGAQRGRDPPVSLLALEGSGGGRFAGRLGGRSPGQAVDKHAAFGMRRWEIEWEA